MFFFKPVTFEFVGFMLRFLLESAGSRREFVLLFAALASRVERQFGHRCQVVNNRGKLIQLFADGGQFFWVGGEVVSIAAASLATGKEKKLTQGHEEKIGKARTLPVFDALKFDIP